MDDLVVWFGKQLDADTARARYARERNALLPEQLRSAGDQVKELYGDPEPPEDEVSPADRLWWLARDAADWIAEHDPARVLREVDTKRRVLTKYAEVADNDVNEVEYAHGYANALGEAVRLLALPYADRSGYREEWRP